MRAMPEKSNKKPQTPEEVATDIETHPERGKLDDEEVVRFDRVELRQYVPRELWRRSLEIGGSMGLNKSDIVQSALIEWVSHPGRQAMREQFYQVKMDKHQVSRYRIFEKILGAYKAVARKMRANLGEQDSGE
jgi:hypothetical protein